VSGMETVLDRLPAAGVSEDRARALYRSTAHEVGLNSSYEVGEGTNVSGRACQG
jgi:hypothetical protein